MYADSETGLYYWNSRYYDPKTGRGISPDQMSVAEHVARWQANLGLPNRPPLEINPYVYTANNPLRWIDLGGFESESPNVDPSISDPSVPEPGLGGVYPEALIPIGRVAQGATKAAQTCVKALPKAGELCRKGKLVALLLGALCSPSKDGDFKQTRGPVRDMTRVEQITRKSGTSQQQKASGPPK
jgi:RHS repeat-associated protein